MKIIDIVLMDYSFSFLIRPPVRHPYRSDSPLTALYPLATFTASAPMAVFTLMQLFPLLCLTQAIFVSMTA